MFPFVFWGVACTSDCLTLQIKSLAFACSAALVAIDIKTIISSVSPESILDLKAVSSELPVGFTGWIALVK